MSKKKFNIQDWRQSSPANPREEVEIVTSRIELVAADIATGYNDWRDLGFALADALGEEGRGYYHRLSRFYNGYRFAETDRQYTACLRSRGHGITLGTFFHLAQRSGIDIRMPLRQTATSPQCTPVANNAGTKAEKAHKPTTALRQPGTQATATDTVVPFPAEVYASLPRLLADATAFGTSPEDTDLLLLGSLTVLSACLTQVYGIYGQRRVYPNLFLFVNAPASAGKGRLTLCRHLVDVVHADLRRQNKLEWETYRHEKAQYDSHKRKEANDEPKQPPVRMLFIPANSSSTALFQTLNDNEGQALMFETEGDTLTTTFKSEHGNYSDGFRKAFHHESIAYNRRKDREYVEISEPRLSVLLSGTPRQVGALIPDAENGLFSRFLFYYLPLRPVWNDVFEGDNEETLDYRFIQLGGRFFGFHQRLKRSSPIRFALTPEQQSEFNTFFAGLQDEALKNYDDGMLPSIRRLGLTAYRICMIFSTLRLMDCEGDAPLPPSLVCRDDDFHTVLAMMKKLPAHIGKVYHSLHPSQEPPEPEVPSWRSEQRDKRIAQLLSLLPEEFNRAGYCEAAAEANIPIRSADRYITNLCSTGELQKTGQDRYRKQK